MARITAFPGPGERARLLETGNNIRQAYDRYRPKDDGVLRVNQAGRANSSPFLLLLVAMLALPGMSCLARKPQAGLVMIARTADTVKLSQQITRIRNLSNDIFDTATFRTRGGVPIPYRLYKPARAAKDTGRKYPLVVIYHGSGSPVGTDNLAQLGLLPKLFASPEIQAQYPAYVLAPQFPTRSSDYLMDTARKVLVSTARPCLNSVLLLIDSLRQHIPIDERRIYAAGFSMGGSTVINSLSARPDLFAAGISIAGIPQFDSMQRLKQIPLWLIHGTGDTENPIDSDVQFYKEAGEKVLFWKLAQTTHENIFTAPILGSTLPDWLFRQRKP